MSAKRPTDTERIEHLLRGELTPAEAERLSTELADDSRVAEVAAKLPDDTLMSDVKKANTTTDPDTEQLAERLAERLKPAAAPVAASVTMTALPSTDSPILLGEDDEPIPTTLEYFKIDRVLGQGGMGTVYLADDTRLGRKVAVKTLKATVARKPGAKERFLREARLAAALEHECVVPIYYVGEAAGIPFLAMPLLKGQGLDEYLASRGGQLPVAEAVRVATQVATGLAAAHGAGLIHRDIKPSNIWVDAGTGRVRILDFGLARSAGDNLQLTASGMIVGTPAYMPPEQARGRGVDHRADLFSLGVMLYQMLVGRRPFTGDDTVSLLSSLALDTPTAPHVLNPEVPPAVSALVMKLLEKEPANRPQSAAEVVVALTPPAPVAVVPKPWREAERTEFDFTEPAPAKAKPTKAARTKPAPADDGPGRKIPLAAWIALGVLLLAGAGAAVYQFAFSTKDGTLLVEVDKDADVRFKNGKLEVYDETGKKLYTLEPSEKNKTLPPGKYRVKVVGADGVKLDTETFELERKGKAWVKVTAAPPKDVAVVEPKKPDPVGPGTPSEAGLRVDQQVGRPQAVAAEVPDLKVPSDGPFTVEGWVKIDRPAHGENPHFFGWTYQFVVGSNGLGIGASLFADDGKGGWTQHPIHAPDTLERGKWQHLAAVRDGKQNRLYFNGALVAKGDAAGPIHTARTDPPEGIFVIGQVCDGVAFREVRVSKVARYAGEKPFSPAVRFEPDKDTLALYHLDDGKGNALADTTGKHPGKVVTGTWGTVPPVTPGTPGGGLLLFASDTGAEAPAPALDTRKPWTAEAYFTPLTENFAKTNCQVIGCDQGFGIGVRDGKYDVYSVHGNTLGGAVTAGERTHIACVQTETKRMLFLNGKLAASADNPLAEVKLIVGKLQFSLVNHIPSSPPIDVLVEGVRISQAVRYTKEFTPPGRHVPDKETLALYHCDEGQGDKLTDSSGNNLHGQITNAKWGKAPAAIGPGGPVVLPPSVPGVPLALRKPTWTPGLADNILPGLVARPAILDGIGRWQIVPTSPPIEWSPTVFSPDGKWVATADATYVRIYDAVTGEFKALGKRTNGGQLAGAILGVDWSPDSKWVRVADFRGAGFDNGDLFATDGTRSPVPYIQHAGLDFGWNPKSPVFACVTQGDSIQIVDPAQAKPVEITAKQGGNGKGVWSPDGETLLVVREDNTAQLFGRDGKAGAKLEGVIEPVATPAWSADGSLIAGMLNPKQVGFWKKDGTPGARAIGKHHDGVRGLHWHPNGKQIAVTDTQGKRHFWKTDGTSDGVADPKDATPGFVWAKDGKGFFTPGKFWPAVGNPSFTNFVTGLDTVAIISPDQTSVTVAKRGEITVAEWKDGAASDIGWKIAQSHDGQPVWSRDGKRLLVADATGVAVYDARDPKKVVRLGGGAAANGLNRAAFSPKGDRLAVTNNYGTLTICEPTGKVLRTIPTTSAGAPGGFVPYAVHDVQWHPDGKRIVVVTGSGTATVYDTDTGKTEATLSVAGIRASGSAIFSPANPDHLLLTHPDASAVWRWKVEKDPLQKHPGLGKLLLSPDGKRFLSLAAGGGQHGNDFIPPQIVSLDLKDRMPLEGKDYIPNNNHPGAALAWHPDGKHLIVTRTGAVGGLISIRSLDGKVVEDIKPDDDVTWLSWPTPVVTGNALLGSVGDAVFLFDLATKKLERFGSIRNFGYGGQLTLSPDGKHLVAAVESRIEYWSRQAKATLQTVHLLPNGEFVTVSPAGEVLEASANAGSYYRYLIEDKAGKLLLKTPAEMAPSLPKLEVATDRKVAAWVFSKGGTVQIRGDGRNLERAAELPNGPVVVTAVNLYGKQTADDELANLAGLTGLEVLNLNGTRVTDKALVHLKGLKGLKSLDLVSTEVAGDGLAHLAGFENLMELALFNRPITDDGLAHLKGLKALAILQLAGTQVSDKGLAHLKELKNLRILHLTGSKVTAAGLPHLTELKALTHLTLHGLPLTAKNLEPLAAALPKCKIEYDGGTLEPK